MGTQTFLRLQLVPNRVAALLWVWAKPKGVYGIMGFAVLNKAIIRGGLTLAAALLLSSATFAQDAGAVKEGAEVVWTEVGAADPTGEWVQPVEDTEGTDPGVEEPGDPGTRDIVIDDGLCIGVGCTPDEGDGEGVIHTMDGDPDVCIDCNVAYHSGAPSEVQRTNTTSATGVAAAIRQNSKPVFAAPSALAQCLSLHPRSTWICEWQAGN